MIATIFRHLASGVAGRSCGCGCLIFGGGSPLLCCGGCVALNLLSQRQIADDEAAAIHGRVGEEVRIGSVGVTVVECVEQRTTTHNDFGEFTSRRPETVVRLRLRNYNAARNAHIGAQSGVARVTDDLGNVLAEYEPVDDVGVTARYDGQIPRGKAIELRADETGSDLLVVERTVPAAKSVTVRLDASRFGGSGFVVIAGVPIRKPGDPADPPLVPTFPPDKFEAMVMGKGAPDVTQAVGRSPDAVDHSPEDGSRWLFKRSIIPLAPGGVPRTAIVRFGRDGKVNRVTYE